VHDTRLPRGAWVSPIGNAAWPSDQTAFTTTLRVWAKDDESITGVKFVVPGITDPVVATLAGGDVYTAPVTIATPAAGSSFTISALISDADSSHTQTITIPITLVHIDTTLPPNFTQAITSTSDAMANTNVLVKGPNTHLVMHVPFTFKNLILLDGASLVLWHRWSGPACSGGDVELYCANERGPTMDAYERLIGDAMRGDSTLFAREDAVEAAWQVLEPVLRPSAPVHEYEGGNWGPPEAAAITAASGGWQAPAPAA